jgi:hypothetical protein
MADHLLLVKTFCSPDLTLHPAWAPQLIQGEMMKIAPVFPYFFATVLADFAVSSRADYA